MFALLTKYKNYLLVLVLTLVGHSLGFGREVALAFMYGASGFVDAFLVGLIPVTLAASILGSAYANSSIVHIKSIKNVEVIKTALLAVLLISGLFAILLFIFANNITNFLAPGLNDGSKLVAKTIIEYSAFAISFVALSAISKGLLHLQEKFTRASISELFPNIGVILGLTIFWYYWGLEGLGFGVLIGYFCQLLMTLNIQFLNFNRSTFKKLFSAEQLLIYKATLLAAISYSVVYVDLLIDRYFASSLYEGAISSMNYAHKIMVLPLYTVIFAITTVIFPKLIALEGNEEQFNNLKKKLYLVVCFISVLLILIMFFGAEIIISLVFGYGEFSSEDVEGTANILRAYSIGLIGHAIVIVASKVRYARKDFTTPLIAGLIAAISNLFLSYILVDIYGVIGLAIATTISAILNALILAFYSKKVSLKCR